MAVVKEVVTGPGMPPGLGPYSQGVRAGDLLFVSGQAGLDPATGKAAGDGFGDQARQAMGNLEAVLAAGGSGLDRVVNTTVLIADFAHFAELNQVYTESFPVDPPARMTVQTTLPGGLLISIGCVALAG